MSRLLLRMKDALMAESHRSTDKGLNKFEEEVLQMRVLRTQSEARDAYPSPEQTEWAAILVQRRWRNRNARTFKNIVLDLVGGAGSLSGQGAALVKSGWGWQWNTEVIGATVRKARTRNAKKGPKARRDVPATTPPKPCPGRSQGPAPEEAPTKDEIEAGWTATEVEAKPSVGVQEREAKAIKWSTQVIGATVCQARTGNAKKGPKARGDVPATTPPKPCPGLSQGPTPVKALPTDEIGGDWMGTEVAAKPSVGVKEREEKAIKASSRPASRGASQAPPEQRMNPTPIVRVANHGCRPTAPNQQRPPPPGRPDTSLPTQQPAQGPALQLLPKGTTTPQGFRLGARVSGRASPAPQNPGGRLSLGQITEARDMVLGAREEFYRLKNHYFKLTPGNKFMVTADAAPSVADFKKWTISMKMRVLHLAEGLQGMASFDEDHGAGASSGLAFRKIAKVAAQVSGQLAQCNFKDVLSMLEAFSDKAAAPGAVIDCKFVDHVEHWLNFLLTQLEALTSAYGGRSDEAPGGKGLMASSSWTSSHHSAGSSSSKGTPQPEKKLSALEILEAARERRAQLKARTSSHHFSGAAVARGAGAAESGRRQSLDIPRTAAPRRSMEDTRLPCWGALETATMAPLVSSKSCSFTAGSAAPLAGLQDSRGPPRHASRVRGPRGSSDQGGIPRPHPASASGRSLQRRSLDDKIPRPALASQTSRQRSSAPGARPRTSAGAGNSTSSLLHVGGQIWGERAGSVTGRQSSLQDLSWLRTDKLDGAKLSLMPGVRASLDNSELALHGTSDTRVPRTQASHGGEHRRTDGGVVGAARFESSSLYT